MLKRILIGLTVVAAMAGGASLHVTTDFDRTVDFRRYTSFDFLASPGGIDQLTLRRVRRAVAAELRARGIGRSLSGRPDLLVAIRLRRSYRPRSSAVSIGYGSWWGGWGGAVSTSQVRQVPVGSLVVDLVDARSNQLVWRGVAEGAMSRNPERRKEKILLAVEKMFASFPRPRVAR